MRTFVKAVLGCLAASASVFALVPGITSVQNPASNIVAGLPNYGIAQGSIFVIYGSLLGPDALAEASSLPYQTTLAGTSVKIVSDSVTHQAPVIYTLSTQVAAVMPSSVKPGPVTVQVTYNGIAGSVFNATVVANSVGISTLNQTGTGPAVVTYPTSSAPYYAVVSDTDAAVPGRTYTIWGTGLGAAADGNSDDNVSVFASVGPAPHLYVGGVEASLAYYGRSPGAGPGLDQINFTIPPGVTGCKVSIVVTTDSPATLSNRTTIPIATDGGACSDQFGVPFSTWSPLLSLSGGANIGLLQVNLASMTTFDNNTTAVSTGYEIDADFAHYTQAQLKSQYQDIFRPGASLGNCVTSIAYPPNGASTPPNYTALDAGSAVSFSSASGLFLPLGKLPSGFYQTTDSTLLPAGSYSMTNGAGGPGAGPIGKIGVTIPAFPVWTNQTALDNTHVPRNKDLTITWSGGAATSGAYIDIQGSTGFGGANKATIAFECTAPAGPGQFTIPADVLESLPVNAGTLQVGESVGVLTAVPGMDLATVSIVNVSTTSVNWN